MKLLRILLWFHQWRLHVWTGRATGAREEAFHLRADYDNRNFVAIARAKCREKVAESLARFHDNMGQALSVEIQRQGRKALLKAVAEERPQ